jgi:anthranilate O-methyltransferase
MVVTFLGRKNNDVLRGQVSYMWALLAQALQSLVQQVSVHQEQQNENRGLFNAP